MKTALGALGVIVVILLALTGLIAVIETFLPFKKERAKKALISVFKPKNKKDLTVQIQFSNISKEHQEEILKDIAFDLMQIQYKIKSKVDPEPKIKNWK